MHTQFTVLKKGLTLIAIPLLVQAVFIAVLVKAHADHVQAQQWAVHTKEVIAKVEEVHRSLIEGYSGIRSAIGSGDPTITGPSQQHRERIPRQIEELQDLVSDNDRQRSRIRELATRSHAFLGW